MSDLVDLPHIDFQRPVHDLSCFEDEQAEIIYASHVLEYYDRFKAKQVLQAWYRVLKQDGILRLSVPDFQSLIKVYQQTADLDKVIGPLYGRIEV